MSTFQPKFLYQNKITDVSQITTSGTGLTDNDSNKLKLFDRNEELKYSSIGSTSGSRLITWAPGSSTSINRIVIQNINFKDFTIRYNNGTDFSTAIIFTGNTKTNLYFEFNTVSVTDVTIEVTDTMTSGDTAKIGQFIVTSEIFEMSNPGGTFQIIPQAQQQIITLSDGTTYKNYVRSIRNYLMTIMCVSVAEQANYATLYTINTTSAFVFIPRPATQTDDWDGLCGHYNWMNAKDIDNYVDNVQVNGYMINLELGQAGGIG